MACLSLKVLLRVAKLLLSKNKKIDKSERHAQNPDVLNLRLTL